MTAGRNAHARAGMCLCDCENEGVRAFVQKGGRGMCMCQGVSLLALRAPRSACRHSGTANGHSTSSLQVCQARSTLH